MYCSNCSTKQVLPDRLATSPQHPAAGQIFAHMAACRFIHSGCKWACVNDYEILF
jgi:hypothetical protein